MWVSATSKTRAYANCAPFHQGGGARVLDSQISSHNRLGVVEGSAGAFDLGEDFGTFGLPGVGFVGESGTTAEGRHPGDDTSKLGAFAHRLYG